MAHGFERNLGQRLRVGELCLGFLALQWRKSRIQVPATVSVAPRLENNEAQLGREWVDVCWRCTEEGAYMCTRVVRGEKEKRWGYS